MSYEGELIAKLRAMPLRKWHKLPDIEGKERMITTIKEFIDSYEPFEFNDTFTKIRRVQLCD